MATTACCSRRSSSAAAELSARAAEEDQRIELLIDDRTTDEHLQLFAANDVCLGPSRWEGLGPALYEAIAFGMPQITNDSPPMNEAIADGVNGLLVASTPTARRRRSGIPCAARRRRADAPRSSGSPTPSCGRASAEGSCGCATASELGAHRSRNRRARSRAPRERAVQRREGLGPVGLARRRYGRFRRHRRLKQGGAAAVRRAARPAGPVHRRRDALGHDAAAADARRAPRDGDPLGDPLRPRLIIALRRGPATAGELADDRRRPPRAGATSASTRPSSRALGRGRPADRRRDAPRLLPPLRREAGREEALGRQDPRLRQPDAADPARPAGGAVHPH